MNNFNKSTNSFFGKKHLRKQVLLLLLIFSTSCIAQNTISENDQIRCALQDRSGRLWFGTSDRGILCYDGQSLRNFSTADGLSNNNIHCMLQDRTGNIWFGTNIGLCRYDGKTFSNLLIPSKGGAAFLPFYTTTEMPEVLPYSVTCMLEDKRGNLWFGTQQSGVFCYDGRSFSNFLPQELVSCLLEDKNGNIWLGSRSDGGVYRYTEKTGFINYTDKVGLSDGMVESMLEDHRGNFWFGTRNNGLCRYDGEYCTNFLGNVSVSGMLEDGLGNLWFGTCGRWDGDGNGVYRYDGKTFSNFTRQDGLCSDQVFCMLEDQAGYIWFGTQGGGLCRFDGTFVNGLQEGFTEWIVKQ